VLPQPVPVPCRDDDEANAGAEAWRGGAEVWIGDRQYLLHDGLLAEQADPGHSVLRRQALGRQLIPAPASGGGYVWLRQAGPAHGAGNKTVRAARQALAQERTLLEQAAGLKAVPRVAQLETGGGRTTLAVTWPPAGDGAPCPTLRASFPLAPRPDEWHLSLLLSGIGGIAAALSALHARGVTHRNLTPDAIIVAEDSRFTLRDLGLAGQPPRPDEGPLGYQAPEQQPGGGTAGPGPATDVWQLAAVTYELLTGHRPALSDPAPADSLNGDLSKALSGLLASALGARPADRPRMSQFRPANG
jgi:hypothetical protein